MGKALTEHGLTTVKDILFFTPRRYVDFTALCRVVELGNGQWAAIEGVVKSVSIKRTPRRGMTIVQALISDQSGSIETIWFNQPYLRNTLINGSTVRLWGQVVNDTKNGRVLRNPAIQTTANAQPQPHYSERSGIEDGRFRRIVAQVLPLAKELVDPLPSDLLIRYKIVSLEQAIVLAHTPRSMDDVKKARHRLAVEELWSLMVIARLSKQAFQSADTPAISADAQSFLFDVAKLPFKLTSGQEAALRDIKRDISGKHPMRRLLNGDVGSGKTVVAFLAARQVLASGYKVIMLAPTTVLAQQHYATWRHYFADSPHILITAGASIVNGEAVSRAKAIEAIERTNAAFVCGTHAVLQHDVPLDEGVGLVIVDEQHRFGVAQRAQLISGHRHTTPHMLSMSATPIPRTAALVLYGDLDISLLPEKPAERKPIMTRLVSERGREVMYRFIDQELKKGRQAYVICPVIELTDEDLSGFSLVEERKAVKAEYERLQQSVFSHRRIGILHGKMKAQEKDEVLSSFRQGELDILLSTSVVEVGVDVPNATAMLIEGAEYFGLAQLHQLRGRVGRSDMQSYCFLVAGHWSKTVKERLELLVEHHDGFTLAEKDLSLRGPGELYGTIQAGIAPFQYASLSDMKVVVEAQAIAEDIIALPQKQWPDALQATIEDRQGNLHME